MKTRDMAYISISAALIALCAWLSVPAAIPFTMQTFAVFAAAGTLGARRGAAASPGERQGLTQPRVRAIISPVNFDWPGGQGPRQRGRTREETK